MRWLASFAPVLLAACGPQARPAAASGSRPEARPAAASGSQPEARPAAAASGSEPEARPEPGPADPPAAPEPRSGGIAQRFLAAHNRLRAKHCAPPLTWSPKLARVAQHWADTLHAKGCVFGHSGGPYGENLAAGTAGVLDPEATVAMWYDEVRHYHFPDGGFSSTTGHFTQLVWRGTKQVGCGHTSCKGNDIWVCNYDPPGNWDGEYRQNVLPASCRRGR